jgi:alpha-galactosidase
MSKIAMIGAGSVVFSRNLTGDLLQYEPFQDATFSYMDIDADRLDVGSRLCQKAADALGVKPVIESTQDQVTALRDADFVVCMVQIGGFNSTLVDFEIPRKYGLNFTIADTTGPGGIFRALRTQPFMKSLADDIMEHAAKDCWLLNYSNPMSMNMRALLDAQPDLNAVGLCHSVQGTLANRAADAGVPADEVKYLCAGINHMSFFLELEHEGQDLYPKLFEVAPQKIQDQRDSVRYELMIRLGYAVTESSEHNAEYSAHFLPHKGMAEKYKVPIDEYLRRCDGIVDEFERLVDFARSDEPMKREDVKKSHEYGSVIANSIVTNTPSTVYGNMRNEGAIANLPASAIIEVPTLVDANGCQPTRVGELPPQLINYMMPHVTQHELFSVAVQEGSRDAVYQACMADPLTAAMLPLDKIVEMADELIAAHGFLKDGGYLPDLDAKRSLIPGSGKHFDPPTPEELRQSWEEAKRHTSDEDVLDRWQVGTTADTATPPEEWEDQRVDASDSFALKPARDGIAVGRAILESAHDRSAKLRIRSDRWRPVNVSINGRSVFEGDEGTLDVDLRQGDNEFEVVAEKSARVAIFVSKPNF